MATTGVYKYFKRHVVPKHPSGELDRHVVPRDQVKHQHRVAGQTWANDDYDVFPRVGSKVDRGRGYYDNHE